VEVVVTLDVAGVEVVVDTGIVATGVEVVVVGVTTVDVVVVVVVALVVVAAEPQDASRSAATNIKDKPNQINLCFTSIYLPFYIFKMI
jgi:hypothetical protein